VATRARPVPICNRIACGVYSRNPGRVGAPIVEQRRSDVEYRTVAWAGRVAQCADVVH